MSQITALIIILMSLGGFASSQIPQSVAMKTDNVKVLELRNYLLKPNTIERFQGLFNEQFVSPMNDLGGYTVGQFRIDGEPDRFVWMRGFENMQTRVKFLNDFYLASPSWKKYKAEANGMMINSDNVYLLRPLPKNGNLSDRPSVAKSELEKKKAVIV